jgi:hypothetical protein
MRNTSNITKEEGAKEQSYTVVSFLFYIVTFIKYLISIIGFDSNKSNNRDYVNMEEMTHELDSMEKNSVLFNSLASTKQSITFRNLLKKAKNFPSNSIELNRRILALEYRIGQANGGIDRERMSSEKMDLLIVTAEHWIKSESVIKQYSKSDLRQMLHETGNYAKFLDLLLQDEGLQHNFFSWVIRDRISACIFIEYPALQHKIVESNLHIRVGHFKHSGLKIQYKELNEYTKTKIVTLLVEGREEVTSQKLMAQQV